MKIRCFVVILLMVAMLLNITSCKDPTMIFNSPSGQEGTLWTAEGADISFGVYPRDQEILVYDLTNAPVLSERASLENPKVYFHEYGSLIYDGDQYDFAVEFHVNRFMAFVSTDVSSVQNEGKSFAEVREDFRIATFRCKFKNRKVFIATVEESTIFEPGTEFVFHRSFME